MHTQTHTSKPWPPLLIWCVTALRPWRSHITRPLLGVPSALSAHGCPCGGVDEVIRSPPSGPDPGLVCRCLPVAVRVRQCAVGGTEAEGQRHTPVTRSRTTVDTRAPPSPTTSLVSLTRPSLSLRIVHCCSKLRTFSLEFSAAARYNRIPITVIPVSSNLPDPNL